MEGNTPHGQCDSAGQAAQSRARARAVGPARAAPCYAGGYASRKTGLLALASTLRASDRPRERK